MRFMKVMLLMLAGAAGCAGAGATVVPGPNGTPAYAVWCRRSVANCYQQAGELCPGGYDIYDRASGKPVLIQTSNGPIMANTPDEMLVTCKPKLSPAAAAAAWSAPPAAAAAPPGYTPEQASDPRVYIPQ